MRRRSGALREDGQVDFRARWRGAWRLLTGRGDEAATCSFCGLGRHGVEQVIAGPGASAICNRCVFVCNAILLEHSGDQRFRRHAEGEHERAVGIQLGHDALTLDTAERAALEALLTALVASLPQSRLLGWSYQHGKDRFDLLTVEIATASDMAPDAMRDLANERWRSLRDAWLVLRDRPANPETPELIERGASLVAAARHFAQGVEAVSHG